MNFTGQFLYELEKQKKKKELLDSLSKSTSKNTSTVAPTLNTSDAKDDFSKDFLKELERFTEEKTMSDATRRGLLGDDIAPVRTDMTITGAEKKKTEEKKKDEDDSGLDFFDKGALAGIDFKKGNTHSQVAKALLGTAADAGLSIVKSVSRLGEGITDLAQYGTAEVMELFGADETAAKVKKNAQRNEVDEFFGSVQRSRKDENFDSVLGWDEKLDKYSMLGETGKAVAEGVGQAGAIVLTGGLGASAGLGTAGTTALTTATMGASGIGSGIGEAYEGGATDAEAWTYGTIAGAADAVTELLSGGMGSAVKAAGLSHGLGGFDDIVAKKLSEKITNTIAKNAVQFGVKATGEGLEEVLAGTVQAVAKWKTYADDQDLLTILEDENLFEQFIVGAMTSGVMQTPGVIKANTSGRDFVTGRTQNEQAVVDRVVEQRVKDAEADGKKLSAEEKQNIEEQAVSDMEHGQISIDTIEEIFGGDTYKAYTDAVAKEDAALEDIKKMYTGEELEAQLKEFEENSERGKLKEKLDADVRETVKNDRLIESYNERERRKISFQADTTKYSEKQRAIVEKAISSGVLNDTYQSHVLVDFAAKVYEQKGVEIDFLNNQKLRESGFAVEGRVINGIKTDRGIGINVDSPKVWQKTVGHEITHVLEGDPELYRVLQDTMFDLAKSHKATDAKFENEYIERLYNTRQIYQNVDGYQGVEGFEKIKQEVVADMVADYLFTDKTFVQNLSAKNRNLFQKIYDEVKYLVKTVTAGTKEQKQLLAIQRAFEEAYRGNANAKGDTQYSIMEPFDDNNGKHFENAVLLDTNFFDGISPRDWGKKLQKMLDQRTANDPFILPIVDENGNETLLQFAQPNERVRKEDGANHKVLGELTKTKDNASKLAVIHIDEIVTTSEESDPYYTQENKHGWLDKNGWLHRNANVINKKTGQIYNLTIDIAKTADGRSILYATGGKIKSVGSANVNSLKIKGSMQNTNTSNILPQNGKNVNKQFSLSAAVEESKNLIAVHNLHTDELLKQLDMGGMPYPSIAVTNPGKISHDDFGEISLVLHRDAIDPKNSKYNKIYSTDAYTPTFPHVSYEANRAAADNVARRVNAHFGELHDYYQRSLRSLRDDTNLTDVLNRNGGHDGMISAFIDDHGMKQLYLAEKGAAVPMVIDRTETEMSAEQKRVYQAVVDRLGADEINTFNDRGYHNTLADARMEWTRKNLDALKDVITDEWASDGKMTKAEAMEIADEQKLFYWYKEAAAAHKYLQDGGVTVEEKENYNATNAKIDEAVDAADYKKWLEELFDGIEGRAGIRNDKDVFTPSGKRRSFEQLHDPVTIDNVINAMRKKGQQGEGAFGIGNIFGASAETYGSISEAKKHENELGKIEQEEYNAIKERVNSELADIATRYAAGKDVIDAKNTLVEAVAKYESKAQIAKYLKQYDYVYKYTDSIAEDIISLRDYIRSLPRPYFEAKPQRAVSFDEVAAFIIPRNADVKVKQELLNHGYSIAEYDPDVEGDRAKVLNSFEEYKFSLSMEGEQPVRDGWLTPASDLRYDPTMTDIAPVAEVKKPVTVKADAAEEDADDMVQTEGAAPVADMFPDDLSMMSEDEGAEHDRLNSFSDEDAPPENIAPYYGDEDAQPMPDDPFETRDIKAVGKRNVESFMSANPEVKPFFQQEANVLLGELERTVKGERFMSADGEWTGTSRHTTDDIAYLLDELKYSYADIRRGLDAIIEGEGAENIAVAKRIEFIINDRLTKGYTDAFSGVEIPPDSEYLNLLREKQVTEYNAASVDALMSDADAYVPPITEDSAPVAENAAPATVAAAEIDAPMAETAAQVEADTQAAVDEIRTTYDKLLAKKQNAETELATNREQRAAASQRYQERIDELTRKYNGKKNKETKAAINLQRQISRLERLRADIDADYAKRISDIEQRIARRDFDLQQDHTQADKLERAYAKIDAQTEIDRAAIAEEFAQRREELSAAVADKNGFVGRRAMELYRELSGLKKGVRASYELGYLLDRGYDWRTLKSTLLKVNLQPDAVINPDSVMESDIRGMLSEEYKSKTYELAELDGEMQDRLAQLDTEAEKQKAEVRKSEQQLRRKQLHQNIMDGMRAYFAQRGYDLNELLRTAKNVSGFKTVDKTPQRVNFAAFGDGAGDIMNDLTVNLVAQHQTDGIRWLNRFTDRKTGFISQISKQYQIKPRSKEAAAAQMYAEGFYVNKYDEVVSYGDRELAIDFPDAKVRENIKKLAHDPRIRQIYDETLDMINESRVRNAYPEIPKRENYFLHFREMGDFFSKNGLPFNPNDMRLKDLPTDINGVTADLKPGQPYFASSKQREGKRTSFDLLGGLEQYLTSAMPQIYHIDDIQTLRALRNYIADDFGQAKGLESLDGLTEEEVQERIDLVYGNHLSNYARFLNEEANIIAGKTALIDRALEGVIGRRGMTFMSDLNKQVGANQVGYSASSALSNVIAAVQAFAKMNKTAFVKGFSQMVSNRVGGIFGRGDNFAQESSVMVRREGAQRFKRNFWQKQQDAAYALMGAVDSVVTEVIARGKYNELTAKGMSSDQAHYETDKWVSALMGDRSLGQQPHLFNSKTFGMILKYQLEVRNQLDSQFEDTFREARMSTAEIEDVKKRNAIKAAKITSTLVTLAVSQHLFGTVMESITGYNPTFDIIEAIIKAAGWDDEEDDDDTVLDNLEQGLLSLAEDMPYYSILSGGRIPMESALPIEQLIKGKDSYGNDKSRLETLAEAAPYYLLPGGYGQIKKTVQGLSMYSDDHPVAGSYTDSGNLRFPVDDAPLGVAQAAIFGQYSSGNARDYFDNERKPLSEKQIDEYAAADMTIQEYWKYRDGLSEHDNLAAQADYINSLDIPVWKKNLFINNLTERKEAIDMTEYGQYGSLAEMDFAKKSPEKYKLIQDHGVSYEQYQAFDDDTKGAYSWAAENPEKYDFIRDIGYTIDDYAHATDEQKDAWTWAYKNPEKYTLSRAVSDDLFAYRGYIGALNDIKADKDADGKSISGSRKEKVIDYINGLDADYGQKIILFKSEYPSEDSYNNDIIDYLNERDDISYEEMAVILTELGFKVSADGTVTWD